MPQNKAKPARTNPAPPQKKTKSRNGCQRCKIKRLKCDEQKPQCQNCMNRSVPCPGYKKSLKWCTKYEVFQPETLDLTQEFEAFQNATIQSGARVEEVLESPLDLITDREGSLDDGNAPIEDVATSVSDGLQVASEADERIPTETTQSVAVASDTFDADFDLDGQIDLHFETGVLGISPHNFDSLPDTFEWSESTFDGDIEDLPPLDNIATLQHHTELIQPGRRSRRLLQIFYGYHTEFAYDPGPGLETESDFLVRFYFENICSVYSAFEGEKNPFRKQVQQAWTSTPSICYAIQSMSAALLSQSDRSAWESKGIALQTLANHHLNYEVTYEGISRQTWKKLFMTTLLLGPSAAWHKPQDLGKHYLRKARKLLLPTLADSSTDGAVPVQEQDDFLEGAMIYWEMLISYVSRPETNLLDEQIRSNYADNLPSGKITPHPWVGIAPHINILFAEVGKLIRHRLEFDKQRVSNTPDPDEAKATVERANRLAHTLEDQLLSAQIPTEDSIDDFHDPHTSKRDLITLAEAYRHTGLLQLYRVFPALLQQRLGNNSDQSPAAFDFSSPSRAQPSSDSDESDQSSGQSSQIFLSSLALHTTSLLSTISLSSGSICVQPIILVASSSELRFINSPHNLDYFQPEIGILNNRVRAARSFCFDRLGEFAKRLPAKPLRLMSELVKETWRVADGKGEAGGLGMGISGVRGGESRREEGVVWVDVMVRRGWETVMG